MGWYGDQFKYALGLSSIFTFYGIAAFIAYYAGDALGDTGYTYRIVFLALLLITLPFALVIGYFTQRKIMKSGEAAAEPQPQAQAGEQQASGKTGAAAVSGDVAQSAQEAVQWLRSTKLAGGTDAVYALPWYITAGPTRSGKTSLVLSSALDFQTLPSQRQAEQNIVRPTGTAEWRVTSSAVFVDTSGRYQTDGAEGEEWVGVLEAIKKVRGSRPIDGLLVPVSAERLLRLNENDIEQQAKNIRARIDEIIQRTKLKFPVYLIFTHADGVEGFRDFFSISQKENKRYVWGATIPLEKAANAHALFDVEYDLLYSALMKRRLFRLANPFPPVRLLRIFNFPQRFADSRRKLGLFTSVLFRPNPFSESPFLRGFYFTANVQPSAHPRTAGVESPDAETPKAVGQGWFVEKFFKDVLLRDKDMVASYQSQKTGPPIFSAFFLILLMLIAIAWVGMTAVSFGFNRKLVKDTVALGEKVNTNTINDKQNDPQTKAESEVQEELDALEELRQQLVKLDNWEQKRPPLYMRFGLYTGGTLNPKLRNVYFEAIRRRYNLPAFAALEKDLRAFAATNNPSQIPIPETEITDKAKGASQEDVLSYHYDLLKAYLMLTGEEQYRDKAEGTFLTKRLEPYWKKSAPPSLEALSLEQLRFFSQSVGRDEDWISRVKSDKPLIDSVRDKLKALPAYKRAYKNIITDVSNKAKDKETNLNGILAGRGSGILISKDNYTVAGAYTIDGYREYMKAALLSASEEMKKGDWVMGTAPSSDAAQSDDIGKLTDLYFRDYTDQWRNMIRSVRVAEYKDKERAIEILTAFSNTDSPMELFMVEVARQTNLSAKPKNPGWIEYFKSFLPGSKEEDIGKGKEVEKQFKPLLTFVGAGAEGDANSTAPIAKYRSEIQKVKDKLNGLSQTQLQDVQGTILTGGADKMGLQQGEQQIGNMLDSFKDSAAIDASNLLKQPLGNLRAMLLGGSYQQVEEDWTKTLYPFAFKNIEKGGFPFEGTNDLPLADLNRYLNPANGMFSDYFKKRLTTSFDDVSGEWKLKPSGGFNFSPEFVKYLNNARKLQEALYPPNSEQPQVEYNIILKPITDGSVSINLDGVTASVASGGTEDSKKGKWPASTGTTQGGKITVDLTDGTHKEIPFSGEWGLFKMFRQGGAKKTEDNKYTLTINVQGTPVTVIIQPASANNPFEQSLFTNLRAPQNIK